MTAPCINMEEMTSNSFRMIAMCTSMEEMDVTGLNMEDMDGEFGAERVAKLVMKLVRTQCLLCHLLQAHVSRPNFQWPKHLC